MRFIDCENVYSIMKKKSSIKHNWLSPELSRMQSWVCNRKVNSITELAEHDPAFVPHTVW